MLSYKTVNNTEKILSLSLNQLVRIYFSFLILVNLANPFSIFREIGIYDTVPMFLSLSIVINLLFVFLAFVIIGPQKCEINYTIIGLFFSIFFPLIFGLWNNFLNKTFIYDFLIYFVFIAKVIIFYNLFKKNEFRFLFWEFVETFSVIALVIGIFAILLFQYVVFLGFNFYYSLTPEITYGFVISIFNNNFILNFLYLLVMFFSGKRMIFVGFLVVLLFGIKKIFNKRQHYFFASAILISLLGMYFFVNVNIPVGVDKIFHLFNTFKVFDGDIISFFKSIDKHRYSEILGILNVMDFHDFIFGKGYGFRYFWADNIELLNLGVTHSNCHFSPLGILSKFGIFGFLFWMIFFIYIARSSWRFRNISKYSWCNFVFIISIYVQSLFAYILFNNPLLPIVAGYVLAEQKNV